MLSSHQSAASPDPCGRLGVGFDPLWGGGVNGAETLHDNQRFGRQVRALPTGVPRLFIG
jgi:hypothetical protein